MAIDDSVFDLHRATVRLAKTSSSHYRDHSDSDESRYCGRCLKEYLKARRKIKYEESDR